MGSLKRSLRFFFQRLEYSFDSFFSPALNPFANLGALGWFFYWIVAVSGIYLYIFFDTGITQAYDSLEHITNVQWYAGGVMRSLHRYASDALVVVVLLHLIREFSLDRMRGKRWFAWFTGIPLLWFIYACGISGYWMVWDVLAQYIAIATTEWLDTLPFFGESIAVNFLNNEHLTGRFFTLMVFIHIALPLIMLFLMWLHIQRLDNARINPPRALAAGTLISMVIMSLIFPAVSQAPADLDIVPSVIGFDWFYLAIYPLLDVVPGAQLWLALGVVTLVLIIMPWLPPLRDQVAAVVNLDNCNGCRRCVDDCPYGAITMGSRTDGALFDGQAVVNAGNCVACGICVGSCPTATPFRRTSELVSGIELPEYPVAGLREMIVELAARMKGIDRVLVFSCINSGSVSQAPEQGVGVVDIPCTGMLPPSFLDFVLSRDLADGVFINGCREGSCYNRLGTTWMRQRIDNQRDPYLRRRVPREQIHVCELGNGRNKRRAAELAAFKAVLRERTTSTTGKQKGRQLHSGMNR